MEQNVNMSMIYNKIMIFFGIVATMPILSVFSTTLFIWMLMICGGVSCLYMIRNKICIASVQIDRPYLLYILCTLISTLICYYRMPSKWTYDLGTSTVQIILMFAIYVFLLQKNKRDCLLCFIKGVYYSAVIQMIWGYLQLILFGYGIDLNKMVFDELLGMSYINTTTQIQAGSIKVSGFCWNAGNLAPLLVFGYVYTKSKWLKCLFLILALISGSRTAALGIVVCFIIEMIIRNKTKKRFFRKNILFALVLIALVVFLLLTNIDWIIVNSERVLSVFSSLENISSEASGSVHLRYLISVVDVTERNDMLSNLFGFGNGCSGYPFVEYYGQYVESEKWVVECDYINKLWSFGYIGFILYYTWYLNNMIKCIKIDKKYCALFGSFLFMGFTYNITFNWVYLLLICIFIAARANIDIFEDNSIVLS